MTAVGVAGTLATPAGAATTTYPAGGSSFAADAQGWTGSSASCAITSGVSLLCSAGTAYDAGGQSLATNLEVTLNVLGLFEGSGTWTSPSFTIPVDADVTGAEVAFDAAFAVSGIANLGLTSDVDVTLLDETDAGTTPIATASLDDRDTTLAPQGGALPGGAIEAGHAYRLVFTTTTTSSVTSAGLLGRASTRFDDVALDVTTADPPVGGGGGSGGSGGGGAGGAGGTGGGGSSAGAGTGNGLGGGAGGSVAVADTDGGGSSRASTLTSAAFAALVRSLDLAAQVGRGRGGSLVPVSRCTIVGTPRADRLVGTRGRDVICGLGGADTIRGGGGTDLIDGGAGRDLLLGGGGGDVLLGLSGRDAILGGAGTDVLAGGAGRDALRGGSGGDRLLGGTGRDVARGTLRHDRVAGVELRRG